MTRQSESCNLSQAMEIFEDQLDEVADSLALNMMDKLEALPPVPDDELTRWVWEGVRELQVEEITKVPLQAIKRIQARKYYMAIPQTEQTDRITPEDIARAKEVPIENLYDGQLRKGGGKMWGPCNFHQEETASFCVHKDNRWSCFGQCGGHGDAIDYIQKRDNVNFIQAVRSLIHK